MAIKNKSMYAILGILHIRPSTGYDIKKYCDTVLPGIWTENFGHIYPTLRSLTEQGLIELADGENASGKIRYRITARGQEELDGWLSDPPQPQPVRSEFFLKFLFASDLPTEKILGMLEAYRGQHEARLATYHAMEASLAAGIADVSAKREVFLRAVLRSGIIGCEGMIRWCDETSAAVGAL